MNRPLLLFRVGWMEQYTGEGPIRGGGSHPDETGEGGEMWNFREEDGRYYGYVMSVSFAGLDLAKVSPDWDGEDELDHVDIVFFGRDEADQNVVIGWYLNATVYHKAYRCRRNINPREHFRQLNYLAEVDVDSAVLLPCDQRVFHVPHGKSFPGMSNVWYGMEQTSAVTAFKNDLRQYLSDYTPAVSTSGQSDKKTRPQPDSALNRAIEEAAIKKAWQCYKESGYSVISVEKDNVGWDLEATLDDETLLVEVKGHRGHMINFELTPNEYAKLQAYTEQYRVCVVRNALTKPDLTELLPYYDEETECYYLENEQGDEVIRLNERVSAKAVQIAPP